MKQINSPFCPCPAGTGTKVLESRIDTRYGWGWRRRECLGCFTDFATYELPVESLNMSDFTPIDPNGKVNR
jgi:transcriptional regulator NrdR family protein